MKIAGKIKIPFTYVMRSIIFIMGVLLLFSCGNKPEDKKIIVSLSINENNLLRVYCNDTSYLRLSLDWLSNEQVYVKDSDVVNLNKYIKGTALLYFAYKHVHDGVVKLKPKVYYKDSLICDTVLQMKVIEKQSLKTTWDISVCNNSIEPFVVNKPVRNNSLPNIREWLYDNKLPPNPAEIEQMADIIYNMKMPNKLLYKIRNSSHIPTYTNANDIPISVSCNMIADNYYFVITTNKNEIYAIIKELIKQDLPKYCTKAGHIIKGKAILATQKIGVMSVFLLGINSDWTEQIVPVGVFILDDIRPQLYKYQNGVTILLRKNPESFIEKLERNLKSNISNSEGKLVSTIKFDMQKYGYYISDFYDPNIVGVATLGYGHFEGDAYNGYDIPFSLSVSGDIRQVEIVREVRDRYCSLENAVKRITIGLESQIKFRFKLALQIGDNYVPIRAIDAAGNVEEQLLSIPTTRIREEPSINIENNIYNK